MDTNQSKKTFAQQGHQGHPLWMPIVILGPFRLITILQIFALKSFQSDIWLWRGAYLLHNSWPRDIPRELLTPPRSVCVCLTELHHGLWTLTKMESEAWPLGIC